MILLSVSAAKWCYISEIMLTCSLFLPAGTGSGKGDGVVQRHSAES